MRIIIRSALLTLNLSCAIWGADVWHICCQRSNSSQRCNRSYYDIIRPQLRKWRSRLTDSNHLPWRLVTVGVYSSLYPSNIWNEPFSRSAKSCWFQNSQATHIEFITLLESCLGFTSLRINSILSENRDMTISVMTGLVEFSKRAEILLNCLLMWPFWISTRFVLESVVHFNAFINVVIC